MEDLSKRWCFVLFAKTEIAEAQVFQIGEDRFMESVEELCESGGIDEIASKCIADPSALFKDEATRVHRKTETLHSEIVEHVEPAAWNSPQFEEILQLQVTQNPFKRKVGQIFHSRYG